jgi:hypothetical protein
LDGVSVYQGEAVEGETHRGYPAEHALCFAPDFCTEKPQYFQSADFLVHEPRLLHTQYAQPIPFTPAIGHSPMKISTVLLNWNRSALLCETLKSYAATVTGQQQIIVVDNGSTDSSREVIADAIDYLPELRYLFLAENLG